MLITAGVYGVASLVTFALLKERARAAGRGACATAACARRWRAWRRPGAQARRYRDFIVAAGLRGLLPGRHRGGHRAGRDLRRAGARLQAAAQTMMLIFLVNIAAAVRRVRASATGRTASATAGAGRHAGRLDRDDARWRLLATERRAVLGGGRGRRAVHGLEPVGRARAGRRVRAAQRLAEFFGLWTFAMRLAAIIGPLTYGAGHLGHRRQPPPRDPVDRRLLRHRPGDPGAGERAARHCRCARAG